MFQAVQRSTESCVDYLGDGYHGLPSLSQGILEMGPQHNPVARDLHISLSRGTSNLSLVQRYHREIYLVGGLFAQL
jgi:hypothetical protein